MSLVSKQAPNFIASAVMYNGEIINNFNFKSYLDSSIGILFFWPMDFTYICPSELIFVNKNYSELIKRKAKLVGVSCDSEFVHKAWRNTKIKDGGVGNISFPMVSDIKKNITKYYNVEHEDIGVSLRATFIIDKNNIVRFELINDLQFGRNFNEILRSIDAINFNDKYGKSCKVNWKLKNEGI